MNLQKKLIQLSEYKCSFKYVESYFLVSVTYPESWSIIPSEDRSIEVAEEDGVTFYAAPIETDIDKAFILIDDTIAYNLDVEKKMALLKYNIGKLQELFAEKDLEELETIEFTFKPKKVERELTSVKKTKQTKKSTSKRGCKKSVKKQMEEVLGKPLDVFEPKATLSLDNDKMYFYEQTNDMQAVDCGDESIAAINESIAIENKYLEEIER